MLSLEDFRWLNSQSALAHWEEMWTHADTNPFHAGDKLKHLSPSQRQILNTQWELAKLAKSKVKNAKQWFWNRLLLEQSSDEWCARETSLDVPENLSVVDLCCGAGSDTVGLSERHAVLSVDMDPIAIELTQINASRNQREITARCGDVSEVPLPESCFIHIDPDRRGSGKTIRIDSFSPSWESIEELLRGAAGASIKVAPGTSYHQSREQLRREPDVIRFLSRDRSVRQQRWIWGTNRWENGSVVLSAGGGDDWTHEVFPMAHWETNNDADCVVDACLRYIGDYDPVVRAAKITIPFAKRHHTYLLGREGGYLTSDSAPPHAMIRWYRVKDILPQDKKKLIAYARNYPTRQWVLKSRGVEVELDKLQKILPKDSDSEDVRTILFCKIGERQKAVIAEEVRVSE